MAVDLPLSSKGVHRFTPPSWHVARAREQARWESARRKAEETGAELPEPPVEPEPPVYLIAPATIDGRAVWRREVRRQGVRDPSSDEMIAALRDAANALLKPAAAEEMEGHLDTVVAAREADPTGDMPETKEAIAAFADFERQAVQDWPPYAELAAAAEYAQEIYRITAARLFLVGWENVDAPFRKNGAGVTAETLEAIPFGHVEEIGAEAMALMILGPAQKKS